MEGNKSYLGIDGVLAIVFVVLKLCGLIDWSWWWVLAPLWISLAVFLVLFAVSLIIHWWRNRKKADAPVRCKGCLFAHDYGNGYLNCDLKKCIVHDGDSCGKGVRR